MTNKVEYVPGEDNAADVISRPSVVKDAVTPITNHGDDHAVPSMNAIFTPTAGIDYLRLANEQKKDAELNEMQSMSTNSLELVEIPLAEQNIAILCDKSCNRLRPVIPQNMRRTVFTHVHSLSHPVVKTGSKLVGRLFVWPGMRRDVAQWTKECQPCARAKVHRHNVAPLDVVSPPPAGRFRNAYVDITGPLGYSSGYNYLLVVIDKFSRFTHAIPLVTITSEECVDAFIRHWIATIGCPTHIFCDRGAQFKSSARKEMCKYLGSQLHFACLYHPQA